MEIERRTGTPDARAGSYRDGRAEIALTTGGSIVVDRELMRATITAPHPTRDEELVHPYLGYIASIVAHWEPARDAFHAGAFRVGGGVWGLCGTRGLGKSSLLAGVELAGGDVLCDDVLVVEGTTAFAGPRALDLRADVARFLGAGRALGVIGTRERWRLELHTVAPAQELLGWVFPAWGERLELVPVGGAERLRRLAEQRMVTMAPTDPSRLVDLAALPAWELRRPRDLHSLVDSARHLLGALES